MNFTIRGRRDLPLVLGLVAVLAFAVLVLNPSVSEGSDRCDARGQTLGAARAAYANNCSPPRVDCDPFDGTWVCSSEQIGHSSPGNINSQKSDSSNQTSSAGSSSASSSSAQKLSAEQQQQIFIGVLEQLEPEQQESFIAQVQQLTADEREQLALSILEREPQQSTPATRSATNAPAEAVPESSGGEQSSTATLTAEQQQQIFVAVLENLSTDQREAFLDDLEKLTPKERETLAISLYERQKAAAAESSAAPAASSSPAAPAASSSSASTAAPATSAAANVDVASFSEDQLQQVFALAAQRIPQEDRLAFAEAVGQLNPAEKQELANQILQREASLQEAETTAAASAPAPAPAPAASSTPAATPATPAAPASAPAAAPSTEPELSQPQLQQIFDWALLRVPEDEKEAFSKQIEDLSPDQQQRLARDIIESYAVMAESPEASEALQPSTEELVEAARQSLTVEQRDAVLANVLTQIPDDQKEAWQKEIAALSPDQKQELAAVLFVRNSSYGAGPAAAPDEQGTIVTVASGAKPAGMPFPSIDTTSSASWDGGSSVASRAKPALGVWEQGDVAGTEIMRVSDDSGNGLHFYNSRQAWNADSTKMMIGNGGADGNRILDVTKNYELLATRIPLNSDRVWSNTNPSLVYGMLSPGESFVSFNVDTGTTTPLFTKPGAKLEMRSKGNLPGDDSKVLLYEAANNTLISYDIANDRVLGELVFPHGDLSQGGGLLTFDWSGEWVTIVPGTGPRVTYRAAADLTGLTEVAQHGGHSDTAYNTDGESVKVATRTNGSVNVVNYDDPSKNYTSPVFGGADPSQGTRNTPDYISGRGTNVPGWIAFGGESFAGSPNHPLGLYRVDGNTSTATIKIIGWDHHSSAPAASAGGNDDRQKPTISPDGTMVAFTSDWGVPNGPLSTYVVRDVTAR